MLTRFSCVWLCVTLWTVAHHAPLSMGFSRQEYWNELACPPPGDLPHPRIKPVSLFVSCISRRVLYQEHHIGSLEWIYNAPNHTGQKSKLTWCVPECVPLGFFFNKEPAPQLQWVLLSSSGSISLFKPRSHSTWEAKVQAQYGEGNGPAIFIQCSTPLMGNLCFGVPNWVVCTLSELYHSLSIFLHNRLHPSSFHRFLISDEVW